MSERRRLKDWERERLWRLSGGRCAICNRALDPSNWHADHMEPFSQTGRTNTYEMQALCSICNLKKGDKSMSDVLFSLRKFQPDWSGYRDDQRRHHEATINALKKGEQEIGHHLHIRGGKSMLIRMLSVDAVELRLAAVCIAVNNRADLREQIVAPKRWHEDLAHLQTALPRDEPYGFPHVRKSHAGESGVGYWPDDPWPNNEYLLSTTIQLLCSKTDRVIEWLKSVNRKRGLPVLFHLDEAQEYGVDESGGEDAESADWYATLARIKSEADVRYNALSGYPFRANGKLIPGFRAINEEDGEFDRWITGKRVGTDENGVPLYERRRLKGTTLTFSMEPVGGKEFESPLSRGFDTEALCPILHEPVLHKVTLKEDGQIVLDNQSLADVDEETVRKLLPMYLEHDDVVSAGCAKFAASIAEKRQVNPRVKGIIYSMADVSGRKNDAHAVQIQKHLKLVAPHLRSRLVTNNTPGSFSDALLAFRDDDYDVLVLKNGGRVGLDCPLAKVEMDWSTVRSEGKVAQTWLRVSTPCDGIPATLITPGDPVTCALFERIVSSNGGSEMRRTLEVEEIDRDEVPIEPVDRSLEVGEELDAQITQNDGGITTPEERRLVEQYLNDVPGHCKPVLKMTWTERVAFVREAMAQLNWRPKISTIPVTPPRPKRTKEPHEYRLRINKQLDKAAHRLAGTYPPAASLPQEDHKRWRKERSEALKRAKRKAGQPEGRELKEINNIEALETIEAYLEACHAKAA